MKSPEIHIVTNIKRSKRSLISGHGNCQKSHGLLRDIPAKVLQDIGSYLSSTDLAMARMTCKHWAKHVAEASEHCTTLALPYDLSVPKNDKTFLDIAQRTSNLSRIAPLAQRCQVLINGRSMPAGLPVTFERLKLAFRKLQHLYITSVDPPAEESKYSYPSDITRKSYLKSLPLMYGLSSLTLKNCSFPSNWPLGIESVTKLVFDSSEVQISSTSLASLVDYFPEGGDVMISSWKHLPKLNHLQLHFPQSSMKGVVLVSSMAKNLLELNIMSQLRELQVTGWEVDELPLNAWVHSLKNLRALKFSASSSAYLRSTQLHLCSGLTSLDVGFPLKSVENMDAVSYLSSHFSGCLQGLRLRDLNVSSLCGSTASGAWSVSAALSNVFNKLLGNRRSSTRGSADDSKSGLQDGTCAQHTHPTDRIVLPSPQLSFSESLTELDLTFDVPAGGTNSSSGHCNALGCLARLQNLKKLNLTKSYGGCIQMSASVKMITNTWAHSLESLRLKGFDSKDIPPKTLSKLSLLTRLTDLHIRAPKTSEKLLVVDSWPSSLRTLFLKHATVDCRMLGPAKLPIIESLALRKCHLWNTSCFEEIKGLVSLRTLQLENVADMNDALLSQLSALVGLTSLSVTAIGNMAVTNQSISGLTTLVKLRKLKLLTGDCYDTVLNVEYLKSFQKLMVLSVSNSMYLKLMRWNVIDILKILRYCDLQTVAK
ncbi:hypothetical protein CEUSTIGMA_g12598.t1 [Chlamydomonas eustigma]|uniref:F-box domain-containing protein n=1 Tax=Chlamydomonas eustigma TaxID=1157962 RepID=A0A250XQV1_9CHLO|nr:hypothetical protein CEUSTIGMA_g12598.t1 [Chlamydomonas eustigma]|eukprot:GAX85180.1 hypothetical protein CEUSTIGMA_g12598.t1 [Chlamydomonas eustigma]